MGTTDHTSHMLATAKLLAQYIATARQAGLGRDEINAGGAGPLPREHPGTLGTQPE